VIALGEKLSDDAAGVADVPFQIFLGASLIPRRMASPAAARAKLCIYRDVPFHDQPIHRTEARKSDPGIASEKAHPRRQQIRS